MKVGDLVRYKTPEGSWNTWSGESSLGIITGYVNETWGTDPNTSFIVWWATGRKKAYPPRLLEVIAWNSEIKMNKCTTTITAVWARNLEWELLNGKNAFNTFLHRIIDLSWLFRLYNECWICWWYLVVTQKILVVVIGHFHTSAKLRRLCGQDFSFCGGYALTKP